MPDNFLNLPFPWASPKPQGPAPGASGDAAQVPDSLIDPFDFDEIEFMEGHPLSKFDELETTDGRRILIRKPPAAKEVLPDAPFRLGPSASQDAPAKNAGGHVPLNSPLLVDLIPPANREAMVQQVRKETEERAAKPPRQTNAKSFRAGLDPSGHRIDPFAVPSASFAPAPFTLSPPDAEERQIEETKRQFDEAHHQRVRGYRRHMAGASPEQFAALEKAYDEAEAILKDPNRTQADRDAATERITLLDGIYGQRIQDSFGSLYQRLLELNKGTPGGFFHAGKPGRPSRQEFGLRLPEGMSGYNPTLELSPAETRIAPPPKGMGDRSAGVRRQQIAAYQKRAAEFRQEEDALLQAVPEDFREELRLQAAMEGFRTRFKGAGEVLKDAGDNWKMVPYLGSLIEGAKLVDLASLAHRLQNGDPLKDDELRRLKAFVDETARERTFWGGVMEVLTEAPAFAGEIASTGGIYTAGRKGTEKVAMAALKKLMTKGAGEALEKAIEQRGLKFGRDWAARMLVKGSGFLGGTALQTPFAGSTRIFADTLRNTLPEIKFDEKLDGMLEAAIEKKGQDWWPAFLKAFGTNFVDIGSERTGGALEALNVFKTLPRAWQQKLANNAVVGAVLRANRHLDSSLLGRILDKIGFHGLGAEVFEERVGEFGKAALGLEEYKPPTPQQILTELTAFSIPGLSKAALGTAANAARTLREANLPDFLGNLRKRFLSQERNTPALDLPGIETESSNSEQENAGTEESSSPSGSAGQSSSLAEPSPDPSASAGQGSPSQSQGSNAPTVSEEQSTPLQMTGGHLADVARQLLAGRKQEQASAKPNAAQGSNLDDYYQQLEHLLTSGNLSGLAELLNVKLIEGPAQATAPAQTEQSRPPASPPTQSAPAASASD